MRYRSLSELPPDTQRTVIAGTALLSAIGLSFAVLVALIVPPAEVALGFAVALGAVSTLASWRYLTLSFKLYTHSHAPARRPFTRVNWKDLWADAAVLSRKLSRAQVTTFLDAILVPQSIFDRISEVAEPGTKTIAVDMSLVMRWPAYVGVGDTVPIPLILQPRGALATGLNIFDPDGSPLPTLNQDETVTLVLAVIDYLLLAGNSAARETFVRHKWQRNTAELIAAPKPVSKKKALRLVRAISSLPASTGTDIHVRALVAELIGALHAEYPIIVFASSDTHGQDAGPLGRRCRFTLVQRLIPSLREEQPGSAERHGLPQLRDAVRRLAAVTPSVVSFPLRNASRAASYHLQVKGFPGRYLARQRFSRYAAGTGPDHFHSQMLPRLGQRNTHLYVRRAPDSFRFAYYEAHFFERLPGSIGKATASAVLAAVLVLVVAANMAGAAEPPDSDVVAALLVVPAASSAWFGSETGGLLSVTLASRVISLITFIGVLTAIVLYMLSQPQAANTTPSTLTLFLWGGIAATLALNAVIALASTALRTSVQAHFTSRTGA